MARSMAAVETTPEAALRKPERLPTESDPKNPCVDEAYEAEMFVVEAFGTVSRSVASSYVNADSAATSLALVP